MNDIDVLKKDMELIEKIVKKEMSVKDLSEDEAKRLIGLCEKENVNMDRRISEKEKYMILLEEQVNQYKKNENQ